jgi:outer membrane protein TolC
VSLSCCSQRTIQSNLIRVCIWSPFQKNNSRILRTNSRELNSQRTGLEVAKEGVKVAKSERLPDINVKLNANYMGNILLTDRDFTNVHGYSAFHFGNEFAIDAQQVVYAGGAINANIKLAQLGEEKPSGTGTQAGG